jgi:SET domain-containing protein
MPTRPFRVGRSLTGLGLFATREIPKRTRIAGYRGPLLSTEEAIRRENRGNKYLLEINSRWTIDGTSRRNVARYANHSCNPNAELYQRGLQMFVRTLRRIKPGEEITYHYGMDYLRNVIGISNCRCGRCRRRKARKQREARARAKRLEARARKKRSDMRASKRRTRR